MSLLFDWQHFPFDSHVADDDIEVSRALAFHSMLMEASWKQLRLPHAAVGVLGSPRSHCPIISYVHGEAWSAHGEQREKVVHLFGCSKRLPARFSHLTQ